MPEKSSMRSFLEQTSLFFGVLFYALFAWHQWWSGVSPRLIRGSAEREAIHHEHLALGATLFVFLIILFLLWLLRPGRSIRTKLRDAFASAGSTAISLFYISMFFSSLYGLGQAWAAGEETAVFGLFNLPHFVDYSWGTAGYLHSSLSNITAALFAGVLFVFLFLQLRRYMSPGIAVGVLMLVHLLVNLPKPPSLHPIAAFGTYILVPAYYFIGLGLYNWANHRRWVYWPVFLLLFLFFMYLPYFAFKVLPPWHMKAAAEIVSVEPSTPLSPVRTKSAIFASEAQLAAAQETASWCAQCHKVTPSDSHLLGPNLVGVFNKQAATVPGYGRNSEAMVAAGANGLFWSRENLAAYLTDGQALVPGNLMNQQTDLSDPQRLEQVIDYIEYLSADE